MSLRSTTDSSNCSQASSTELNRMGDVDNAFDDSAMYTQVLRIGALEDIIEEMKCFLCKGVPPPDSTLVCRNGHMVCVHCFNVFPNRGCCKELDISGELCKAKIIRINLALYSFIYNNAFHSCKFVDLGCNKQILGYNIAMHSHNCKFRIELPCAFTSCQDTTSYKEYVDHIRLIHQVVEINSNEGNIQVGLERANNKIKFDGKSYRWVCGIIRALNSTFLLMAEEHLGGISMWLILSPTDAESDYEYSLNILAAEDVIFLHSGKALTWEGHVQPFEGDLGSAFLNGECFTVSKQIFKKYSYEDNRKIYWNLRFSVSRPVSLSPTQVELDCPPVVELLSQDLRDSDLIDLIGQDLNIEAGSAFDLIGIDKTTMNEFDELGIEKKHENTFEEIGIDIGGENTYDQMGIDQRGEIEKMGVEGENAFDKTGVDRGDEENAYDEMGIAKGGEDALDKMGVDEGGENVFDVIGIDKEGENMYDEMKINNGGESAFDEIEIDKVGQCTFDEVIINKGAEKEIYEIGVDGRSDGGSDVNGGL